MLPKKDGPTRNGITTKDRPTLESISSKLPPIQINQQLTFHGSFISLPNPYNTPTPVLIVKRPSKPTTPVLGNPNVTEGFKI